MATNTTFRENLLRVIAVIGLIAVLLLGAWGIIQLAFYLPTFFSNWGKAKESLSVLVPAQTTSDKAAIVSWKHTGKNGEYSYALSYTCAPGLAFAAPVPTGAYQLVPCDTPFNYVSASSSMQIIPVLAKGTAKATTTISVAATNLASGTITLRGKANTTVSASTTSTTIIATTTPSTSSGQAKPATKPATTQKPATTYVPSGRTQNLYGSPDLIVQITSAPQSAPAGSRVALQFVITNIGTNVASQGWMFNALLPYNPVYIYPSVGQQLLYPGDKIVYTLGYDVVPTNGGYYSGSAQATIQVDPNNYLFESSEANNAATAVYQVY